MRGVRCLERGGGRGGGAVGGPGGRRQEVQPARPCARSPGRCGGGGLTAVADRPQRVRLRTRRRRGPGLHGYRGRRARHRQVHAAAPVLGASGAGGGPPPVRLGRRAGPGGPAPGGGVPPGPKTLEHIADTVLYFEGETSHDYRVLRAVKNRFGSVDEVGVFEMTGAGLTPVGNPSAPFLAGRDTAVPGSAVTAVMEGSRPLLIEIQALAVKSGYGTPQRVATGLDSRRLAGLLAGLGG